MPPSPLPPDIPEGLEHLLPLFVAEMVKDAARLAELMRLLPRPADVSALADLAEHSHAMRGKAGLFGENQLYTVLTKVERLALAGNADALPPLIARVSERSAQLETLGRDATAPAP